MKIYLLRHGQTDWNVEGRLQGLKNIPMNDNGVKQMTEIGKHLSDIHFQVDVIIASPLDRAKESAKIIAEKIGFQGKIIYDEDFLERSFGAAEGLIWNKDINLEDEKYSAESVEDVCERGKRAVGKYLSNDGKNILIVAHGAILSAVKHALSQGKLEYYDSTFPIIQGNILCCEIDNDDKVNFYNLFQ